MREQKFHSASWPTYCTQRSQSAPSVSLSPPLKHVSATLWPFLSSTFTIRPVTSSSSSSSCLSSPLHLYLPIKVCHGLRHLPYVTGAHIRENNLWLPWIRDGARFPMIRLWYENSLQYLDRREAADRCSPARCRQTRVSETSCREHPGGPAGWREEEEEEMKVKGKRRNVHVYIKVVWK